MEIFPQSFDLTAKLVGASGIQSDIHVCQNFNANYIKEVDLSFRKIFNVLKILKNISKIR